MHHIEIDRTTGQLALHTANTSYIMQVREGFLLQENSRQFHLYVPHTGARGFFAVHGALRGLYT